MRKEIRDKWLQALRSGSYSQTKDTLHAAEGGLCCLGVLCDLAVIAKVIPSAKAIERERHYDHGGVSHGGWEYDEQMDILPTSVQAWAGISDSAGSYPTQDGEGSECLATMNDSGMSFKEIADVIESDWEQI